MKEILPDGSTMESTHIETLQILGLSKQSRQIHIPPKMQTPPLLSLGVLCDDICTITLDKERNIHPEEWRRNNQRDHKQEDRNARSVTGATTIRKCGEENSSTNLKTRTSPVFTCSTFHPNYDKSPQFNQTRFPEDLVGSHRKIIKKNLKKSRNTTMGHMDMRRQGLQSTKEKTPDIDLEDKIKTNVVHWTTVDPRTTK